MTYKLLARGNKCYIDTLTTSVGDLGGEGSDWTAGTTLYDCNAQTMSGSELLRYQALGSKYLWTVFFGSDVNLTTKHRIRIVRRHGNQETVVRTLRVLDYYTESNPKGKIIAYVADCNEETP